MARAKRRWPLWYSPAVVHEMIENGAVCALNFPIVANPGLAKAIGTLLKQDFQRAMIQRIPTMERDRDRYFRPVVFLCDEYQAFATVGESDPTGDEKFFALSSQAKCIEWFLNRLSRLYFRSRSWQASPRTSRLVAPTLLILASLFQNTAPASVRLISVDIDPNGTSATLKATPTSNFTRRITLVATNRAGASDSSPGIGFIKGSSAYNTISVPGSNSQWRSGQ